jgi:hypothetical protein
MATKLILGGKNRKSLILGGNHNPLILGGSNTSFPSSSPQPVDYGSASNYALSMVGNGPQQTANAFGANNTGNALNSINGQYTVGGRKRSRRLKRYRHGKRYSKRGGGWGSVLGQAAVPFTILGLQQTYGKRGKSIKNRTQKRRFRK